MKKIAFRCCIAILFYCYYSPVHAQSLKPGDPAFKSSIIAIDNVGIPKQLQKYSGIRFIDVRYSKTKVGLIPTFKGNDFVFLQTKLSFEDELNNLSNKSFKALVTDSIIVLIKNFWVNQIRNPESADLETYCHVSALFFVKQSDSVFFDKNIDTFFIHKINAREIYKTIAGKSIEDLLAGYNSSANVFEKRYSSDGFDKNLHSKRSTAPSFNTDSNGVFLSFKDFLKGKLFKTDLFMDSIFDQYYYRITDETVRGKIRNNVWGILYKGDLYLNNGRLLSKAYPFEDTFIANGNLEVDGVAYSSYTPYHTNINSNADLAAYAGAVAFMELLKKKKTKIRSIPMILNMETGRLE